MVFEHLRAPPKFVDPHASFEDSAFDPYKPLIYSMAVCHKWYVVALEKASLWTDVGYSHHRPSLVCLLERSGTAPIHLRLVFQGSAESRPYFCKVVRTNASRLRQLDLYLAEDDTVRTVGQLLENDMPLLRCLTVSDVCYQRDTSVRNTSGRFPSLRGLMLMGHF